MPPAPAPKFWEYTYGVPLAGLQRVYERTHDQRYLAFIKKYVDRYVDAAGTVSYARPWLLGHDGKASPPNDPTIQDVIQPSVLLFGLYDATHDQRYLTAISATRQIFRTIKTSRTGAFWHKPSYPDQQWLDGIYMAEPFLVRYGALFADQVKPGDAQQCFRTATGQIEVAAAHTMDPKTKLYYHAWNDALDGAWRGLAPPTRVPPPDGAPTSPVLWSRAIGWYIAGIVDVLEYLPAKDPERPALRAILRNLADGLERFQDRKTGLWYQVIDVKGGPLPPTGGYAGEHDRPAAAQLAGDVGERHLRLQPGQGGAARRAARALPRRRRQSLERREVAHRCRCRRHGTHPWHGGRAQRRRRLQRLRQCRRAQRKVWPSSRAAHHRRRRAVRPRRRSRAARRRRSRASTSTCATTCRQGFGAVLLASSEMEFPVTLPHPAPQPVARSK